MLLLSKVHSLFRFPWFLPNFLFLFQDPIQDTNLHLLVISHYVPLGYDSFSDFPCF